MAHDSKQPTGYENLTDEQILDEVKNKKVERLRDSAYLTVLEWDLRRHIQEKKRETHKGAKGPVE